MEDSDSISWQRGNHSNTKYNEETWTENVADSFIVLKVNIYGHEVWK